MLLFLKIYYKPEQHLKKYKYKSVFLFVFTCNNTNPFSFFFFFFISVFKLSFDSFSHGSPCLRKSWTYSSILPLHVSIQTRTPYLWLLSVCSTEEWRVNFPYILIMSLLPFPSLDMRDKSLSVPYHLVKSGKHRDYSKTLWSPFDTCDCFLNMMYLLGFLSSNPVPFNEIIFFGSKHLNKLFNFLKTTFK